MSEEDALLAAICANPDDDTARLVYADWLDEYGDAEHAELIRLQIEGARSRRLNEEAWARCCRLRDIFEANESPRKKQFCPSGDVTRAKIEFERGFPGRLTLTDPTVNEFAILTWLPTLRYLILQGRYELTPFVLALITDLPCLDVLCVWDVEVSATALIAFERLPPWVVFSFVVAGGDEAAQRFRAGLLTRFAELPPDEQRSGAIRSLRFRHDLFPPHPGELVTSIRVNHITHPFTGDDELARLSAITEVEEIHLLSVSVTTEGLRYLARFPNLMTVVIENCPIDSYKPLTACPKLESLRLDWDSYTGEEIRRFLETLP